MPRLARFIALAGCLALVLAAACRNNEPESTVEPTTAPEPTASVESIGEFQLVATIEQALLSIEPGIDLPSDVTQPGEQGEEQTAAGVAGVMRGEIEAFSDNLRDRCGADDGDRFNLFWTPGTLFDDSLVDRSLEIELEGRRVGVVGTIFMRSADGTPSEEFDLGEETPGTTTAPPGTTTAPPATTTPVASPGVTTGEGEDDCVLVLQEVGITTGTALPTRRPTATARPTAAATRSPTPTPARTPTPTPVRTPTPTPTETPEDTPTDSPETDARTDGH